MSHNFLRRRRRLKAQLKKLGTTAFLVTNIKNVGYLTGFTGSAGYLLVTPKTEILLSDTRYSSQILTQCPDLDVDIRNAKESVLGAVARVTNSFGLNSIAYESQSLTKSDFDQLESKLSSSQLISSSGVVRDCLLYTSPSPRD